MKKYLTLVILLTLSAFSFANSGNFLLPAGLTYEDYVPNTLILKVKNNYRYACGNEYIALDNINSILSSVNAISVKKVFPFHNPPEREFNEIGFRYADLSLIYEVRYDGKADMIKTLNSLLNTGMLEYAEPKYLPKVSFTPNDPQLSLQSFLLRINAYDAWDISKGDSNTIIGIIDTGTDWDHPDLEPNIKYNYADPINGIDDDGDSFTDNYRGWDVGENDNDPIVGNCGICFHGSHVSGCASAATDNGIGVASPGFNCKFLPVKVANANGALTGAYEGIVYAADHGCQIINCSWGGGGGGIFGQNVIDYATVNKNSLVIAAAGNNGSSQLFYPAAYNHVLCVAATNSNNDVKAGFSNYGIYIDVCAPGDNIYSTVHDDSYMPSSGTSMAAPITAGVAAVVKSHFPSFNAWQIGEQVRTTTDNIYSLGGNSPYIDDLGTGRINMLNALTLSSPAVRMNPVFTSDHNDDVFVVGDTLFITGTLINYLDPTVNLAVMLSTTSSHVTVIDNLHTAGAIGTMGTANNNSDPFVVRINPGAPQNAVIPFKISFQDGSYNDFQMLNVTVNVDYLNITVNDIWTTNTSKGRLAYNGENQTEGFGFDFLNEGSLTYEAGFMAGTAASVSDNMRNAGIAVDNDWLNVNKIQKAVPGAFADFESYGTFNDNANPLPLGLSVNHHSFSWSSPPHHRYHIFEYTMHNSGGSVISNLYGGIFSDWDIQDYTHNKAGEDAGMKMGYAWNTDSGGYYAGIKLLTAGPFNHYAIDNISGGAGGVDLTNGYPDNEKYQTLSTQRSAAGGAGQGNDIIEVVSSGPFTLNPGDSVTVAFALIAGVSLSDILESAAQAQLQYDPLVAVLSPNEISASVYPNPASGVLYLTVRNFTGSVNIILSDISGRKVRSFSTYSSEPITLNTDGLNNGFYLIELSTSHSSLTKKVLITGK